MLLSMYICQHAIIQLQFWPWDCLSGKFITVWVSISKINIPNAASAKSLSFFPSEKQMVNNGRNVSASIIFPLELPHLHIRHKWKSDKREQTRFFIHRGFKDMKNCALLMLAFVMGKNSDRLIILPPFFKIIALKDFFSGCFHCIREHHTHAASGRGMALFPAPIFFLSFLFFPIFFWTTPLIQTSFIWPAGFLFAGPILFL